MAGNRKTRFSAVINQSPKLILSVEERANGDLIIIIPSAGRIYDDGSTIKNQKYSIHRSLASATDAFTIKQTIDFVDQPALTTAQFRNKSSDDWLVPVFMQRVKELSYEKYSLAAKAGDVVIPICEFDERSNSLCYALFLSATRLDLQSASQSAWNDRAVHFDHFSLHIFFGFLWVRALPNEDLFHSMTSLPRRAGEAAPDRLQIDLGTANPHLVPQLLDSLLGHLCKRLIERIQVLTNNEPIPPEALPLCYTLCKEPCTALPG